MRKSYKIMGLAALGALIGCHAEAGPGQPDPERASAQVSQAIGEGVSPRFEQGVGTGLRPSYQARLMGFMYNRIRIAPHLYGIPFGQDENGNPLPAIPAPPARLDPELAAPAAWYATHVLEEGCACSDDDLLEISMGQVTNPEMIPFVGATCCTLELIDGQPACASPFVACTADAATLRESRWRLMNLGVGRVTREGWSAVVPLPLMEPPTLEEQALFYTATSTIGIEAVDRRSLFFGGLSGDGDPGPGGAMGISFFSALIPPPLEDCIPDTGQCPNGQCQNQTTGSPICPEGVTDCAGRCAGGGSSGGPCTLPKRDPACDDPANFVERQTIALANGDTSAPVPVLTDGIHAQFTLNSESALLQAFNGWNILRPDGTLFYATPSGQTTFAVHYYETNGDPLGTPNSIEAVVDGACQAMTLVPTPETLFNGVPAPYSGDLFVWDGAPRQGCVPYAFVAEDASGFEYVYPSYGSLQANIGAGGEVIANDEACPIWVPERLDISCAGTAQECTAGETRSCYTGLRGTDASESCEPGTETCVQGRWGGTCAGELTPQGQEVCFDNIDNNCNLLVDEGCFCDYLGLLDGVCFQIPLSEARTCDEPATYEETETSCDQLDNDCDGVVDEGCTCAFNDIDAGVCAEAVTDSAGNCPQPAAYTEVELECPEGGALEGDGSDNDCDGVVDEGCGCLTDGGDLGRIGDDGTCRLTTDMPDAGADAGPDAGGADAGGGGGSGNDDEGCGCASTGSGAPTPALPLLFGGFLLAGRLRRRRRA